MSNIVTYAAENSYDYGPELHGNGQLGAITMQTQGGQHSLWQ